MCRWPSAYARTFGITPSPNTDLLRDPRVLAAKTFTETAASISLSYASSRTNSSHTGRHIHFFATVSPPCAPPPYASGKSDLRRNCAFLSFVPAALALRPDLPFSLASWNSSFVGVLPGDRPPRGARSSSLSPPIDDPRLCAPDESCPTLTSVSTGVALAPSVVCFFTPLLIFTK